MTADLLAARRRRSRRHRPARVDARSARRRGGGPGAARSGGARARRSPASTPSSISRASSARSSRASTPPSTSTARARSPRRRRRRCAPRARLEPRRRRAGLRPPHRAARTIRRPADALRPQQARRRAGRDGDVRACAGRSCGRAWSTDRATARCCRCSSSPSGVSCRSSAARTRRTPSCTCTMSSGRSPPRSTPPPTVRSCSSAIPSPVTAREILEAIRLVVGRPAMVIPVPAGGHAPGRGRVRSRRARGRAAVAAQPLALRRAVGRRIRLPVDRLRERLGIVAELDLREGTRRDRRLVSPRAAGSDRSRVGLRP